MTLLTTAFVDRPLTVSSGNAFARSYWAENAGPLAAVLTPGHYLINSETEITVTVNPSPVDIVFSVFRPGTLNRAGSDVIIPAGETGVFTVIYDYACGANTMLVAGSAYTHDATLRTVDYSSPFPAGFEATGRIRFKLSDVPPGCAAVPNDDVYERCVNLLNMISIPGHDTADFLFEFLPATSLNPGLTEDFDTGAQEFTVCSPGDRLDSLDYYTQFFVRDPEDEWGSAVQYGVSRVFLNMREYAGAPPDNGIVIEATDATELFCKGSACLNLLNYVLIDGQTSNEWPFLENQIAIELNSISGFDESLYTYNTETKTLCLDDAPFGVEVIFQFLVRVYEPGTSIPLPYDVYASKREFFVALTLEDCDGGEGGEGGEDTPCPGIAYFSRTMPSCNTGA